MKLQFSGASARYEIDAAHPIDISIPLNFNGGQPNHFGAEPAAAQPLEMGGFIGDTRRGGSCNVEIYRLIPHCNGTHTECAGHITGERLSVNEVLRECLFPATLATVQPLKAAQTSDTYQPAKQPGDELITRDALETALQNASGEFLEGLILRTLPNDASKKSRRYTEAPPPFFSLEAMRFLSGLPLKHLLVDIPSLDRMFDEGQMNAHRIFWNIPPGSRALSADSRPDRTVTEMIYVPEAVTDGRYLASIHIPPFIADAAPGRILLFPIRVLENSSPSSGRPLPY
ncbi:MAG: cyclase family protein [Calditrichaceae bacterium]|nr:cyclase family protein [Calditrichia bacterium]NUQ41201.1 cyclase family protein [Calditrichaceae bacterium]